MSSTTLDEIQSLKDAKFHALCDELLPRMASRYHPLVPHGRNATGDSIAGQPDSYVGDSAASCRIAIQYTVQKRSWWSKAVADVEDARAACTTADEIVIVLPRDIDREKAKKGDGIHWRESAEKAASPASLTVLHGPALAQQLDTTCQDLRFIYLGIPFSRLSWQALMAGCRAATSVTLERLKELGRYQSDRYVSRDADDRFFKLWQESQRSASGQSGSERRTLLPIVADSGIGKTSLLSRFSEQTVQHTPVLLLLARDLSFDRPEALTDRVLDRLQGSVNPETRSGEEAYLASLLSGKMPLTVVLDGLDEATNVAGVRKALDHWVWSRLGRSSVLVVSSRPEFWRNCKDMTWSKSIVREDEHPKARKSLRHERDLTTLDPMQGIDLPGTFSASNAANAWVQAGRSETEFWQLPKEVRGELQHPFTLRSVLDLVEVRTPVKQLRTRSSILNLWIQSRLSTEANAEYRVTESQYRQCLLKIARQAATNDGSWVSVEELDSVPRFDPVRPPGAAVERLIASNILETHPDRADWIRFSFEAVQDFFLAESMIEDIKENPSAAARHFAEMSFSSAVARLERIGEQIATEYFREEFVRALASLDGPKAAVVLRANAEAFEEDCREFVVSKFTALLSSRMMAEQALATELLGRMRCDESKRTIANHWTLNEASKRVYPLVSSAAISHSIVELVPHVFRTWWFTRDRYFVDLRPELLATTQEFRDTLTSYAAQYLSSQDHSDDYQRSLMVLGYLKDDLAVDAIRERTKDATPFFYESMCLLASGSQKAVELYSSLIDRFLDIPRDEPSHEEYSRIRDGYVPHAQVANLATSTVEDFVCDQIDSDDRERQLLGRFLSKWLGTSRLLRHMVKRWRVEGYIIPGDHKFGRRVGADGWLDLWCEATTRKSKTAIIQIAADIRDVRVEDTLIQCLQDSELAGSCAQSLGFIGSQRACPALRQLLNTEPGKKEEWNQEMAFMALARLRDPASVAAIARYLESEHGANQYNGTIGLGCIGTEEAETALLSLNKTSKELLVRGLVHFGSPKCVERAIEIAKESEDEPAAWLVEQCRFSFGAGFFGGSSREYRTDVAMEQLLDFVLDAELTTEMCDHLRSIIDNVDSPSVRELLRNWYDRRGTSEDTLLESPKDTRLSDVAFRQLETRGDEHVLEQRIRKELDHYKDYEIHDWVIEQLAAFDRTKVQQVLRTAMHVEEDEKKLRVILDLIGHVGDDSDIAELENKIIAKSGIVANAAFEAKLRLTDPLRLAKHW